MSAGDTLILLSTDSTRTTYSNATGTGYINNNTNNALCGQIPSGASLTQMTTVQGQIFGNIVVEGGTSTYRTGLLIGATARKDTFINVRDIIFLNGGYFWNADSCTVKNCGFYNGAQSNDGALTLGVSATTHNSGCNWNLFEDIFVWGKSQRIICQNYHGTYNVWRRVIIRGDGCAESYGAGSGNPNVRFTIYESSYVCVENMFILNSILGGGYPFADFACASKNAAYALHHLELYGSMSLASPDKNLAWGGGDYFDDNSMIIKDFVAIDAPSNNVYFDCDGTNDIRGSTISNITAMYSNSINIRFDTDINDAGALNLVASSGTYNTSAAFKPKCVAFSSSSVRAYFDTSYNATLTNLTTAPFTAPRSIKHPIKIETGSTFKAKGIDGDDIGANILFKYGTDGTRWGETGYNTITADSLWPYPNELIIKNFMTEFGSSTARGFCVETSTNPITHYVWDYFGQGSPYDPPSTIVPSSSRPRRNDVIWFR
jgi:hypothetical protein